MNNNSILLWLDHPKTLNYAITCVSLRLEDSANLQSLVVDYKETPEDEIQTRLPGGRFQAEDLFASVESFLKRNGRNKDLEFLRMEVDDLNKKHLLSSERAESHYKLNQLFNEFTAELLTRLQSCSLSELEFNEILEETHFNTVNRELREEADAIKSTGGVLYLASFSSSGAHYKMGFTTIDVEAPDCYTGSPDPKILKSYWQSINKCTVDNLFNGHKLRFHEGIAQAVRLNLHPNVKFLKEFVLADK